VKTLFLIALAALGFASPGLADAKPCGLVRAASLDMTTDSAGGVSVPMSIAGQTVNLLIATGGIDSMLTVSAVESLKLKPRSIYRREAILFGGAVLDQQATAYNVDLGGLKAERMFFMIMPDGRLPYGVDGILAPDVLRAYDDELDFANAKFNLFLQDHCKANMAYWTKADHAEIPFGVDKFGHLRLFVELDGKRIPAEIETGESRSVLNLDEAEHLFGFRESEPLLKTLAKTENGHIYKFPFKALTFGGVTVFNPDLQLFSSLDERMADSPPLLLGMGILRQLHMYIAYKENVLYVTAASAH
jgi:predicted aspartyl protease